MKAKISLEQWQTLIAVVDEGGYAQAAESMNKSQSAVSYAIQKLETQLSLRAFKLEGRRSVLTPVGKTLYQRAKHLVEDAVLLEDAGQLLAAGAEAEVRIAVDTLFPTERLLAAITAASQDYPATQFALLESTLSGPNEALLSGEAELVITAYPSPGTLGETVATIEMIAVAAADHPLHQLGRTLTWDDLRKHQQVVVKDTGQRENRDAGWLGAEKRLTVTQGTTALLALVQGMAFSWFPKHRMSMAPEGELRPLPLQAGRKREVQLQLVYADRDYAGPATRHIANTLLQRFAVN